ncbi:hypothetical protein Daus18300_005617 [Diaporthe australafricana]|uniref:Major facilitator superfamily (MFS) profile domain-containing protein n=1 Tax=Diaporthe australafricana TaxID=127596 RepID=A0ABR3X0V3_9PEZI
MSTKNATANRYNFLIVFLVTFGSLTYGYNSAIIGAVLGLSSFFKYFGIDLYGPNAAESSRITGTTNGVFAAGGLLGCILMTWLGDAYGRKVAIQVTSVLCVIAGIVQAASVHIAMFLVGRFLMGVGVGMVNAITPLYQSEISPAHLRGRMVGTHGFILCVGYALAGWTGFGCFYLSSPDAQWRLCLALQVVPPVCLLIGSLWLPESPRYLMAKDRFEEGIQVLRDLHRVPGEEDDFLAREEFYQIRQQLELERREGWRQGWLKGWILLFQRKSCRKRLLFGFLTLTLVQSTGCLVINNYQVLLYNGLGLYGSLPLLLYAVWDIVTFFAGSMDATSYVFASELFPTSIRTQGAGFSISALFCMSLIYTMCAPVAFTTIGWKYYLIFIIIPLFGAAIMYFFYPETKGLTLEEIGKEFGDVVAIDLSAMNEDERRQLNKRLVEDEFEKEAA